MLFLNTVRSLIAALHWSIVARQTVAIQKLAVND